MATQAKKPMVNRVKYEMHWTFFYQNEMHLVQTRTIQCKLNHPIKQDKTKERPSTLALRVKDVHRDPLDMSQSELLYSHSLVQLMWKPL